ncbi:MAG: hypothetical protein ACN4GM_14875 [Gammaproteobacteria bacterium]
MSTSSLYAGNQGVSGYFGFGLGGSSTDDSGLDVAATGSIVAGIEEDGWAVEYGAFISAETGSDDPAVDYTLSGSQLSLSYRTVESGGHYYKVRYGTSDVDVEYKNDVLSPIESSGNIWGLAIGFRMGRAERLEIEYGIYLPDEATFNNTHMLMFSYLWGGPSSGRR